MFRYFFVSNLSAMPSPRWHIWAKTLPHKCLSKYFTIFKDALGRKKAGLVRERETPCRWERCSYCRPDNTPSPQQSMETVRYCLLQSYVIIIHNLRIEVGDIVCTFNFSDRCGQWEWANFWTLLSLNCSVVTGGLEQSRAHTQHFRWKRQFKCNCWLFW